MPKQETKFNEEELKVVKSIQEDYITVQHRLGQLSVARIRLDQQSIALDEQEKDIKDTFTKTQNHEKEFIASITEKYGDGVLDPKTGAYQKTEEPKK